MRPATRRLLEVTINRPSHFTKIVFLPWSEPSYSNAPDYTVQWRPGRRKVFWPAEIFFLLQSI